MNSIDGVTPERSPMNYRQSSTVRSGLTLIEVMIATTITLLMMLALAQGFKTLSESVSAGRAKLTLGDQLRGVSSLLRSDLSSVTVDSSAPQSFRSPSGYFKYYDGPISDFTATLFNYLPTGTVEQRLGANRWGDIDDIVMFTMEAKEGEWFRGKIPRALLLVDILNKGGAVGTVNWNEEWATDVSIASKYAEVLWFMRPLQEYDQSSVDPTVQFPINIQELAGGSPGAYTYGLPPVTAVQDLAPGVDTSSPPDGIPDQDGMPDRIALCRRVLLLRPDLDISETAASSIAFAGRDPQLTMKPLPLNVASVDSFRYVLRFAYQRGDLSVRAISNSFTAATSSLTLKTNALGDLQLPENRFAHYTIPLSALGLGAGTSLPILSLTSEATSSGNYLSMTNQAFGTLSPVNPALPVRPTDRGFIPSCFFRTKISLDPAELTRVGKVTPTLEEIVASNVVAFDLKGYDLALNQLASPGTDGSWGDRAANANNISFSGAAGADDLTLTPSDPGYSAALIRASSLTNPHQPLVISLSGGFVDLDWCRKVIHAPHRLSSGVVSLGMANSVSLPIDIWPSNLSCVQLNPVNDTIQRTNSMVKSGNCFVIPSGVAVYQPCFDTFTDAYESDGEYMEFVGGSTNDFSYVAWRDGLRRYGTIPNLDPAADLGSDRIGIDAVQKETSPPVPYKLPSIQATIRVQDFTAGTLQQISVVHDLNN